jgi:hypothetical protein
VKSDGEAEVGRMETEGVGVTTGDGWVVVQDGGERYG